MKKFLAILFVLILNMSFAVAKEKNYSINFNGEKFNLLYSTKDKDFGGYLNEYYKHGETYNIWSELVAVHHFPNAYSPIDRIRDFKDYLSAMKIPSSLTFDDKRNTALIDFIVIKDNNMPIVLEFNIFKYEKSKKCGSIAIQYAKRYSATTTMQIEEIKKDFEKNRMKLIKKVEKFEIPTLVTTDIDKCISALDVKGTSDDNKLVEENNIQKSETNADNAEIVKPEIEEVEKQENKTAAIDVNETENKNDTSDLVINSESANDENVENSENKEIKEIKDETDSLVINTDTKIDENETESAEPSKDNELSEYIDLTESEVQEVVQKQEANEEDVIKAKDNEKDKETIVIDKEEKSTEIEPDLSDNANIKKADDTGKQDNVTQAIDTESEKRAESDSKNVSKNNEEKEVSYKIVNDKKGLISQPRTKAEIKAVVKQKRLEAKKRKKQLKMQAKLDKKTYEISNTNRDLIAKPRSKKELKQQTKLRKKQAKKRVKQAESKLND